MPHSKNWFKLLASLTRDRVPRPLNQTLGALMAVIEKLMESVEADINVLHALDRQGDRFSISRPVDFLLRAESREKAVLVAGFINDYQSGIAKANEDENGHSIQVLTNTPVEQNVILSISGFMLCIAELYGLEYDGWGCTAQTHS